MVPKRSDHYLDLFQCPDKSLKDALKQTMLNQENMFRKQVQELHRVYQMQMIMMKNSRLKEMAETQYMDYSKHDYRRKRSQWPLDFELPTGYYANCTNEHFLHRRNGWGTQEKPIEVECYFQGEADSSSEEVKLSLNIGGHASDRSAWKSQKENATPASSPCIIDLEESTGIVFSRDGEGHKSEFGCAVCSAHSGDQNCLHFCCSGINNLKKGFSISTKRSLSFVDESTNCREKSSLKQGLPTHPPGMGVSVGEISTSSKGLLDLNVPPHVESSFYLKDHALEELDGVVQERASPDSSSCRKPNDDHSYQVSTLVQQHTPTSILMAFNSSDNSTNGGSNQCSIDLELCSKAPSGNSEDQECLTSHSLHKEGEFGGFKLGFRNSKAEEGLLSSYVCRKEDTIDEVDIHMSPIGSKPDDNAADPSTNLKTVQSGAYLENFIPLVNSLQSSESSQVDSSRNSEDVSRSSAERNEESALDDALVRRGTVSILYFMWEISAAGKNYSVGEDDAPEEIEEGKGDQTERSLDSFESAVLKIQESKIDDYNDVSSNTYEVKAIDGKDCPIKLRRGRRMKDFQKDILPSLASLSRHEIREDVRLMEGVIRSREYRRLRSKACSEQNWFTPVKSRRSRLNYTGRKRHKLRMS